MIFVDLSFGLSFGLRLFVNFLFFALLGVSSSSFIRDRNKSFIVVLLYLCVYQILKIISIIVQRVQIGDIYGGLKLWFLSDLSYILVFMTGFIFGIIIGDFMFNKKIKRTA